MEHEYDFESPRSLELPSMKPRIAFAMASDSDLPALKPGMELLESLEIPYYVASTPGDRATHSMREFALSAASKGFSIIIAATGSVAHLPGMMEACSTLPVIAVSVKGSTFDIIDGRMTMPRGVPGSVGSTNSVNGALLAARIVSMSDETVRSKLLKYNDRIGREVEEKSKKLRSIGYQNY